MQRIMLKSKIYNIKVMDANLHYQGSITIDSDLLKKSDILEFEQVHVLNITNGQRFETYAICGNLGEICVNGAAAKLVEIGDELIILAYGIINSPMLHESKGIKKYMNDFKEYPKIIKGEN